MTGGAIRATKKAMTISKSFFLMRSNWDLKIAFHIACNSLLNYPI